MPFLKPILMVWMFLAGAVAAQTVEQGVIVTGEAQVSAPPDMATLTLGVSQNAQTAKAVMAQVNAATADILVRLESLGIAPRDMQTSGFYLHPVRAQQGLSDADAPKIAGYQAGNAVTVTLRDLAQLGPMMDAVIDLGGNEFNGLQFGLQDDREAMAQARAAAVKDAQTRAAQLAQAAGITLGGVARMTEHGGQTGGQFRNFAARSTMSDAVAEGEVDVRVQVTMVYAIAPGGL